MTLTYYDHQTGKGPYSKSDDLVLPAPSLTPTIDAAMREGEARQQREIEPQVEQFKRDHPGGPWANYDLFQMFADGNVPKEQEEGVSFLPPQYYKGNTGMASEWGFDTTSNSYQMQSTGGRVVLGAARDIIQGAYATLLHGPYAVGRALTETGVELGIGHLMDAYNEVQEQPPSSRDFNEIWEEKSLEMFERYNNPPELPQVERGDPDSLSGVGEEIGRDVLTILGDIGIGSKLLRVTRLDPVKATKWVGKTIEHIKRTITQERGVALGEIIYSRSGTPGNLSTLLNDLGIGGDLTEWLDSAEVESETEMAIKNVIEGVAISKLLQVLWATGSKGVPAIFDYMKQYQPRLHGDPGTQQGMLRMDPWSLHDGRQNEEFFSGKAQKASSSIPYRPVLVDVDQSTPEAESYLKYTDEGNFTGHISKMIPGFAEKQIKVGQAIVRGLRAGSFLDIGASEGGLAKTVGEHLPDSRVVALDPNPDMLANFNKTPEVTNVEYVPEAFNSTGWDDIKGYKTDEKFDVINEDFTFQFINNKRDSQVAEVKKLLKKDGVFITSEKFHTANSKTNEIKKLDHQRKYFSADEITQDEQEIVTGMASDMVSDKAYEKVLRGQFKHVEEFWNAGDFKGYVASDSRANIDAVLRETGDLSSEYTDKMTNLGLPAEESAARLRRQSKRSADIGAQKNKRTVLKAKGKPNVVVGRKTKTDWKRQVTHYLSDDEIQEARKWYKNIYNAFQPAFGERTDQFVTAWLMANKNASPDQALQSALRVAEQIETGVPGLKGGLNDAALRKFFSGESVEQGLGQKLVDFIDSATGRQTRQWMGDDPTGGMPAVVDIHSFRDMGYIDDEFFRHLEREGYDTTGVELDLASDTGGSITETKYENAGNQLRKLTDDLNKEGWMGGEFEPSEVQAIGWMAQSKLTGAAGLSPEQAVSMNRRRISYEIAPGAGSPNQAKYGDRFKALDPQDQFDITRNTLEGATDKVNELVGVQVSDVVYGLGGWEKHKNPAAVNQMMASKETAEVAANAIGYLTHQEEVWVNKIKPMTKTPKGYGISITGDALGDEAVTAALWEDLMAGSDLIRGYQPITVDGQPGIMVLIDKGGKRVLNRINTEIRSLVETAAEKHSMNDDIMVHIDEAEITKAGTAGNYDGESYLEQIRRLGRKDIVQDLVDYGGELEKEFASGIKKAEKGAGKTSKLSGSPAGGAQ